MANPWDNLPDAPGQTATIEKENPWDHLPDAPEQPKSEIVPVTGLSQQQAANRYQEQAMTPEGPGTGFGYGPGGAFELKAGLSQKPQGNPWDHLPDAPVIVPPTPTPPNPNPIPTPMPKPLPPPLPDTTAVVFSEGLKNFGRSILSPIENTASAEGGIVRAMGELPEAINRFTGVDIGKLLKESGLSELTTDIGKNTSDYWNQKAKETEEAIPESSRKSIIDKEGIVHAEVMKDPSWWANSIGGMIGTFAPIVLAGEAAPFVFGAQSFGNEYDKLRNEGMSPEEAGTRSIILGGITTGLFSLGIDKMFKGTQTTALKRAITGFLTNMAIMPTQAASQVLDEELGKEGITPSQAGENAIMAAWKAVPSGIGLGLIGAGMGAIHNPETALHNQMVDDLTQKNIEAGKTPEEARTIAEQQFQSAQEQGAKRQEFRAQEAQRAQDLADTISKAKAGDELAKMKLRQMTANPEYQEIPENANQPRRLTGLVPQVGVQVPLMITAKMRENLKTIGFNSDQISEMTPTQAWMHIKEGTGPQPEAAGIPAQGAQAVETQPSRPETPKEAPLPQPAEITPEKPISRTGAVSEPPIQTEAPTKPVELTTEKPTPEPVREQPLPAPEKAGQVAPPVASAEPTAITTTGKPENQGATTISAFRDNPPQVAQPITLEPKITFEAKNPSGKTEELSGKGYVLPGFEQYKVVLISPRGNKTKGTKSGWSVWLPSVGEEIAQPRKHLMEDSQQSALNLALKRFQTPKYKNIIDERLSEKETKNEYGLRNMVGGGRGTNIQGLEQTGNNKIETVPRVDGGNSKTISERRGETARDFGNVREVSPLSNNPTGVGASARGLVNQPEGSGRNQQLPERQRVRTGKYPNNESRQSELSRELGKLKKGEQPVKVESTPAGKTVSVPKEQIESAEELHADLSKIKHEVFSGRPTGKQLIRKYGETGKVVGQTNIGSAYPKGWDGKKTDILGKAIEKAKSGKLLGKRERQLIEDAHNYAQEKLKDEIQSSVIPVGKSVASNEMEKGDLVRKNGEWFKVDYSQDGGVVLKDGKTIPVPDFESTSAQKFIKPDHPLYKQALSEYNKQERQVTIKPSGIKPKQGELIGQEEGGFKLVGERIADTEAIAKTKAEKEATKEKMEKQQQDLFAEKPKPAESHGVESEKKEFNKPSILQSSENNIQQEGRQNEPERIPAKSKFPAGTSNERTGNELPSEIERHRSIQEYIEFLRKASDEGESVLENIHGVAIDRTAEDTTDAKQAISFFAEHGYKFAYVTGTNQSITDLGNRVVLVSSNQPRTVWHEAVHCLPENQRIEMLKTVNQKTPTFKQIVLGIRSNPKLKEFWEVQTLQRLNDSNVEATPENIKREMPNAIAEDLVADIVAGTERIGKVDPSLYCDVNKAKQLASEYGIQSHPEKPAESHGIGKISKNQKPKSLGAGGAEEEGTFSKPAFKETKREEVYDYTGLRKSVAEPEREALGLPKQIPGTGIGFEEAKDIARKELADHPLETERFIKELENTPRALNTLDVAKLTVIKRAAWNARQDAAEATHKSGTPEEKAQRDTTYEDAAKFLNRVFDVSELGKNKSISLTGGGLGALRMLIDEKYSLVNLEEEARAANGHKELSKKQREELEKVHAEYEKAQDALDALQKKSAEEKAGLESEMERMRQQKKWEDEVHEEIKKQFSKKKFSEKARDYLHQRADEARARIKARGFRVTMGLDPEAIIDHAIIGAEFIADGIRDSVEFGKKMVKEFGEYVKPYLNDLWLKSLELSREGEVKANKAGTKERVSKIEPETNNFPKLVKELMRQEVENGVRKLDEAVANVHELVKEKFPDKTERDIRVAFSDYGKVKQPSQEETDVVLRDLRAQSQKVSQLEDVMKGESPKKSGFQREPPSQIVRDLTRQVSKAMKDAGIEVRDPETQLKSSLDAVHTRLENQIEDLQKAIDARTEMTRNKGGVEYDQRAKDLVKQRDNLQEKYDKVFDTAKREYLDRLNKRIEARETATTKMQETGQLPAPKTKRPTPTSPEITEAQARLNNAIINQKKVIFKIKMENRPTWEKVLDQVIGLRKGGAISGIRTAVKVIVYTPEEIVSKVGQEIVGGLLGHVPGVSKIMENAPSEGRFSGKAIANYFHSMFTKGIQDQKTMMKGELPDYVAAYEKNPRMDMGEKHLLPAKGHALEKALLERGSFELSKTKREEFAERTGQTISDEEIGKQAFKDAQRSILMDDNLLADGYESMLARWKNDKNRPIAGKLFAATAKFFNPVYKVALNHLKAVLEYSFGHVLGLTRLGLHALHGFDKMTPEQYDSIARQLKRGTFVSALCAYAFWNAFTKQEKSDFGGFYTPGEKRKPGQLGVGEMRIGGQKFWAMFLLHPSLIAVNFWATVGMISGHKQKKDGSEKGLAEGMIQALFGMMETAPIMNESVRLSKIVDPRTRGQAWGDMVRGFLVPVALEDIAKMMDLQPDMTATKRKPETMIQHMEMGIPGLRQNVPEKPELPSDIQAMEDRLQQKRQEEQARKAQVSLTPEKKNQKRIETIKKEYENTYEPDMVGGLKASKGLPERKK